MDRVTEEVQYLGNHVFAQSFPVVQRVAIGIGSHEVDSIQLQPRMRELAQELIGFCLIETTLHSKRAFYL